MSFGRDTKSWSLNALQKAPPNIWEKEKGRKERLVECMQITLQYSIRFVAAVNATVDIRKSVSDVRFTGASVGNSHNKTLSTGRGDTTDVYHWPVELCYHGNQFYCVPRGPLQTQLNAVGLRCRVSKCVLFDTPTSRRIIQLTRESRHH